MLIVAICAVPALSSSLTAYLQLRAAGEDRSVWLVLLQNSYFWVIFAALTPAVLAVVERAPLGQGRMARSLAIHLASSIVFALVLLVASTPLSMIIDQEPFALEALLARLVRSAPFLLWGTVFYWLIVAVRPES